MVRFNVPIVEVPPWDTPSPPFAILSPFGFVELASKFVIVRSSCLPTALKEDVKLGEVP